MIKRYIAQLIEKSLTQFPGVLLNGARQVGKSTLMAQLLDKGIIKSYVTLDDLTTLTSCRQDPEGFLSQYALPLGIDEIQRCPELLIALKRAIDQRRQPGQYLLTGSANILSYPGVLESLAGRIDIISLEGFSLGELVYTPSPNSFLRDIFSETTPQELILKWSGELKNKATLTSKGLHERVFYGGFPDVSLRTDPYFHHRWFAAYGTSYMERDVRDLARSLDVVGFSKVCRLVGLQTGNLLNVSNLALDVGLDQRTVRRYLEILEMTFQARLLQPYHANLGKRLIKTPKVYWMDSGYASYFSDIQDPDHLVGHRQFGHLLETWVYGELRKLMALETGYACWFYRTHQGAEVDFVMTRGAKVVALEVKASASLKASDLRGMKDFLETVPHALGIVLYQGTQVVSLGERLVALPYTFLNGAS